MSLKNIARPFSALALAGAASLLVAAPVAAEPTTPQVRPGEHVVIRDVLGPRDPGFWDTAVPGTRIWAPVPTGAWVTCASGFVPVPSCTLLDRWAGMTARDLLPVDVPVPGGPLRVWFDRPQASDVLEWNNGSVAELITRFYLR